MSSDNFAGRALQRGMNAGAMGSNPVESLFAWRSPTDQSSTLTEWPAGHWPVEITLWPAEVWKNWPPWLAEVHKYVTWLIQNYLST